MFEVPPVDIGNVKMLEGRTTENETMMTFDALGFYAMVLAHDGYSCERQ
jgi:hypothetical protein